MPRRASAFSTIMQAQATRMARLIDDLLSLSRIELNAHLRPDTPVDLAPSSARSPTACRRWRGPRRRDQGRRRRRSRSLVLGDRDELIRVFENLIENALKYAPSGKRVDIDARHGEGHGARREARVAVRDYGPGIAPEHLPRLTERFYRVDVAESRAQGGTGLGLALVKHILNRHRGRLTIESVWGRARPSLSHLPLANPASSAELQAIIKDLICHLSCHRSVHRRVTCDA